MRPSPVVSVVIPTWNPGASFPRILDRIREQRVAGDIEIIIIDSGSSDGTVEFLKQSASYARLIEIPNSEYNHGRTRDLGIRSATAGIVVLMAQDALPADNEWLPHLLDCYGDPDVAGAYSRQLPQPDASPFLRNRLQKWMPESDRRVVQAITETHFDSLPLGDRLAVIRFDNVSSSVRRDIALKIPFGACRFGEDLDWSQRVMRAGYRVAYEPRSRVIHSHAHSTWYEFKRAYLDHHNRARLFGSAKEASIARVLERSVADTVYFLKLIASDTELRLASRILWSLQAWPFAASQNLGQYLGMRSVAGLERGSAFYRGIDDLLSRGV